MKRREFLINVSTLPIVAGLVTLIAACGSGGGSGGGYGSPSPTPTPSPGPAPSPAPAGGTPNCNVNGGQSVVSVASGHTHPATNVPSGDVVTATQKTYTVPDGGNGHTHTFTVAASQFTTLQGNVPVTITTDPDGTGHTHSITVNCV
jgi:hypothetical protein